MTDRVDNEELRDLGTHMSGAVKLHETRHTKKPMTFESARPPSKKSDNDEV